MREKRAARGGGWKGNASAEWSEHKRNFHYIIWAWNKRQLLYESFSSFHSVCFTIAIKIVVKRPPIQLHKKVWLKAFTWAENIVKRELSNPDSNCSMWSDINYDFNLNKLFSVLEIEERLGRKASWSKPERKIDSYLMILSFESLTSHHRKNERFLGESQSPQFIPLSIGLASLRISKAEISICGASNAALLFWNEAGNEKQQKLRVSQ